MDRYPAAVELHDVTAAYGSIKVLHGVDLTVPGGSLFAILGPNGAGKTTTLKLIDGRHAPSGGCVHVAGRHVNGARPDQLAAAGLCSIPEGRGIFPNLTVEENLRMMAFGPLGLKPSEIQARAYEQFPVLGERRRQVAGTLSGGQQQMLALSRAIVSDPSLLLVDELSMGLAPLVVAELYEVLRGLAAAGTTILLVEQFANTALAMADYVAVMVHGEVRAAGRPADMEAVAGAYLGAGV